MNRCTALLLLLALSAGHAQAANLVASVDRSRLNSGATVELTVESSDSSEERRGGTACRCGWTPFR